MNMFIAMLDLPGMNIGHLRVFMMPVMTAFFTVTLPAGLGLYWIISSVVQILQQLILNAFLDKKGEEIVVTVPEKKQQHRKKRKK